MQEVHCYTKCKSLPCINLCYHMYKCNCNDCNNGHRARIGHIYMKALKKEIYWQYDLMAIKKSNVACIHRRNISQYDSGERCGPWVSCCIYTMSVLLESELSDKSSISCEF
jgi:hypothetical protein